MRNKLLIMSFIIFISVFFITCSEVTKFDSNKFKENLSENKVEISRLAKETGFVDLTTKPLQSIDFILKDLNNKQYSLKKVYEKGNFIILNFWAMWCTYCKQERPYLEKFHQKYKNKNIKILSVHTDPKYSISDIKTYINNNDINYTILADTTGSITSTYQAYSLPMTFIISPTGEVLFGALGMVEWHKTKITNLFDKLLKLM